MAKQKINSDQSNTAGTIVSLYSGTKNTTGTVTIGDISNYRLIIVKIRAGSTYQASTITIPFTDIAYGSTDQYAYQVGVLESSSVNCYVKFTFTNSTTLNITALGANTWASVAMTNVYGVK